MLMQGLAYSQQWGGMRVAMATSFLALVHAEHLAAKDAPYAARLTNYAKYQVWLGLSLHSTLSCALMLTCAFQQQCTHCSCLSKVCVSCALSASCCSTHL